jgi:diguanylate cyclase (GGDEF)-like protein
VPPTSDLALLTFWLQEHLPVVGAAAAALALLVAALRRGRPAPPAARPPAPPPSESDRELCKTIHGLEEENAGLTSFFVLLPDLTKEINSIKEKRKIAPLMVKMLEQIFDPKKILIFFADERQKSLYLVEQKGFSIRSDVHPGMRIPYGEGRVGWVAQNRVAMDSNDFANESRMNALALDEPKHRLFGTELCAPMVHDNTLFGVISIGGLSRHPKLEKRMCEMVADLGSVALNNIHQFNLIQQAANSDGLTKLFNKRYFLTRFGEEIIKAEKARHPLSLFIFDIDHFKKYNDTHGHQAGDECLKLTAQIFQDALRDDDIPARYGGEEFVVILPNTNRDGAVRAAEKVRLAIESRTFSPPHPLNPGGKMTISGGVATYPDDGTGSADLIRKADAGLYEAKRQGRNRICVVTEASLSGAAH